MKNAKKGVGRPGKRRSKTLRVVRSFIRRINEQDAEGLAGLMTAQHCFVDSGGNRYVGRQIMREGWRQYFSMFPGYRIEVEKIISSGTCAAVFGVTSAVCAKTGKSVRMPAAWLAKVSGGLMREWRVYADNDPARKALDDK